MSKEDRKIIYKECYLATELSFKRWSMLMGVGSEKVERDIAKKLREDGMKSSRGVAMSEVLAAQLLSFLASEGYNLMDIAFDEKGRMIGKPSKMK